MGPLAEVLLCSSVSGVGWASLSIVLLLLLAVGREEMVTAPPTVCDSAVSSYFHDCPAFLHRHFPPQSPPSHLPHPSLQVNSSPHPGIAPQSLNPSSQPLPLPGDQRSGPVLCKDCLILIPFKLPQIRCITFSLKCFLSDSYSCLDVRI